MERVRSAIKEMSTEQLLYGIAKAQTADIHPQLLMAIGGTLEEIKELATAEIERRQKEEKEKEDV